MGKRELRIKIAEDGSVTVGVTGAPGASCLDATKFLEDALGVVSARDLTGEYYEQSESALVEHGE